MKNLKISPLHDGIMECEIVLSFPITEDFPYQTNLANVAVPTLNQVMQDPNAPAAARVSAARTALELAGDLGTNSG